MSDTPTRMILIRKTAKQNTTFTTYTVCIDGVEVATYPTLEQATEKLNEESK